jgi:hypothetical protein
VEAYNIINAIFEKNVLKQENPSHPHFKLAENVALHPEETGCPDAACEVEQNIRTIYQNNKKPTE